MRSLIYAVAIGLLGALGLHIIVILAVPVYSGLDAYARVLDLGADGEFKTLPDKAPESSLSVSGPFRKEAVCAFSFDNGPVMLASEGKVPLWSATVFDSASNEIFSMNDRTSSNGTLNIVAGTEAQIAAIRKAALPQASSAILVAMPSQDGYAVLRVISPEASTDAAAAAFLDAASCGQMPQR